MKIAKGFQDKWSTIAALEALLPAARVFTGRIPSGTAQPYAMITIPTGPHTERSDKRMRQTYNVRIQVWPLTYDTGEAIQAAIEDGFSNIGMDLDDGNVSDVRHVDSAQLQEEDTTDSSWQFITVFDAVAGKDRTI